MLMSLISFEVVLLMTGDFKIEKIFKREHFLDTNSLFLFTGYSGDLAIKNYLRYLHALCFPYNTQQKFKTMVRDLFFGVGGEGLGETREYQ